MENYEDPCCGICEYDANKICVGCKRTHEEILDWDILTEEERKQVYERIGYKRIN